MIGPVQVLVVGFDQPSFSGDVLAELTRLREAGIVRLVDLLLVSRADAVPAGTAAAVALIEHVWAAPLRAAIDRAGGHPLEETWLAADDRAALEDLMSRRTTDEEDTT